MNPLFTVENRDLPAGVTGSNLLGSPPSVSEPCVCTPCEITEVYDGDTITVRVSIDLRVRLLECWADEVHTKDEAAKVRGIASRDHLRGLAPNGSKAVLTVPMRGARLDDILTMGRVLGYVSVNGQDLSARQVADGFAKATKE